MSSILPGALSVAKCTAKVDDEVQRKFLTSSSGRGSRGLVSTLLSTVKAHKDAAVAIPLPLLENPGLLLVSQGFLGVP